MPSTSVHITKQLSEWINQKVASGDYNNASEIFREGLRILKARDERESLEFELLCQKVSFGIDQANYENFSNRSVAQIMADAKAHTLNG